MKKVMPRREVFEAGYFYHIYNRWKDKQKLFRNHKEYKKFINWMFHHKSKYKWFKIVTYCILPNHFHLLIKVSKTNYEVSKFMERWCGAYARSYTEKHKVSPPTRVFESNFHAKKIETRRYLDQCYYYVLSNAVKHWLVESPSKRAYWGSSYLSNIHRNVNMETLVQNMKRSYFEDREY